MKIKQEEDLFCSKLKPRTTEVPLTARMRSRVTIKKEEQPHKVRKTRKVQTTTTAARAIQQEASTIVLEVTVKEEPDQIMDIKHQTISDNNETRNEQEDGSPEDYCDLCNLFFKNRHQYRRHYRKKHMILPYKPSSRHRPPVNPHLSPDLNDPNHYCRACEKKFPSQTYYRRHAKTAHKIRVTNPFYPNYDPNKVPDINDPNFYCRSCEKRFISRKNYLSHIKNFHKLIEIQHKLLKNSHLKPDFFDPTNHCCCCEVTYSTRGNYLTHLRFIHHIEKNGYKAKRSIINLNIIPAEVDPDNYCKACEIKFKTLGYYRQHLMNIHKMTLSPIKHTAIIHFDKTPDLNDPNFYCCACEKTYSSNGTYRLHLRDIHKMETPPRELIKHPNIAPDIDDFNSYCRSCELTYKYRQSYRAHLKSVHNVVFPNVHGRILHPDKTPDKEDPNFYRCACEMKYSNRDSFRLHLRRAHRIAARPGIVNPDAIPDPYDPNNYCNACEKGYTAAKMRFRRHLQKNSQCRYFFIKQRAKTKKQEAKGKRRVTLKAITDITIMK